LGGLALLVGGGYGIYQWHEQATTGSVHGRIVCGVTAEGRTELVLLVRELGPRKGPHPEGGRIREESDFPYTELHLLEKGVVRHLDCTGLPCDYEAKGIAPGNVSICAVFTKQGGTFPFIHTGSVLGCAPLLEVSAGETEESIDFELDFITGSSGNR